MRTPKFADTGLHTCDGCGKISSAENLEDIEDLGQRVEAGGTVPSGECPECGALCYPSTPENNAGEEKEGKATKALQTFPDFPDDWDAHNADAVEAFADAVRLWKKTEAGPALTRETPELAGSEEPDEFTRSYLGCALWSTNDGSTPDGGEPLDKNYGAGDIAKEALAQAAADCARFQKENQPEIEAAGLTPSRAGHCFWLNRNGHGSGFWDEEFESPEQEKALEKLSEASKAFGEADPYVGDDGLVYGF